MPLVIGVDFRPVTKIYSFDATGYNDLRVGDHVVVETAQGREVGQVAHPPRPVDGAPGSGEPLKPVIRRATAWDLLQKDQYQHQEAEALEICKQKVAEHGLDMKLVRTEYNFDGGRLVIHYTADKRVDFRNLLRDLAKTFRTRIEMKQIGVRDEAKLLDGIGRCGRKLCCSSWLREFNQISIKMAKNQDLPLNPLEISGVCGRLLCCLSYEDEHYSELKKTMPKIGATVTTPKGKGKVLYTYTLQERVEVEMPDGVREVFDVGELEVEARSGRSCGSCGGCSLTRRLSEDNPDAAAAGAG